jgi:hypothetical protein
MIVDSMQALILYIAEYFKVSYYGLGQKIRKKRKTAAQ